MNNSRGRPRIYANNEESYEAKKQSKRNWYHLQKERQAAYNKSYYEKKKQKKNIQVIEPTNECVDDNKIQKEKLNHIPSAILEEIIVISKSSNTNIMQLLKKLYANKIEPIAYNSIRVNTFYLIGILYLYFPPMNYRWNEYTFVKSYDINNDGRYIHISPSYDIYEFIVITNGNKIIYNFDILITDTNKNDIGFVKKTIEKSLTLFPRDILFDIGNGQLVTSEIFGNIVKQMLNMNYSLLKTLYMTS
jgi:hypothetical protein